MSAIKKKRVSKRSKLAWRKHVNINDVEDFLEDKRLEERLGPPLATLSNDELFKVDTKPDEKILSSKEKKRLKALQPAKCFAILEPHTKVPDPITKRNRVRSKEERKNEFVKKKEEERQAKGIVRAREQQSLRDRKKSELKKRSLPKRGDFDRNIWDDEKKDDLENNEWITENTKKHHLVGSGKIRKTVKNLPKVKTSILPSVEAPHPGMSYNPSFHDHQDLISKVAEKEIKLIKQEEHLNRVTRDMFKKIPEEEKHTEWLNEMSQGLPSEKNSEDLEDETDDDYKTVNPPVKNTKKTLKQRRKQKEQRQQELLRHALKLEKKKVTDLHQLRLLQKKIENKEKRERSLREKRAKIKELKEKEPKRLGSVKFEEPELEFNLGTELTGNLRTVKKEGNLLNDRFKSLQKRNIIEPTIRRNKKKGKVKIYTKPGHKDDWIKTVARPGNV